jgi:hypothetical protein
MVEVISTQHIFDALNHKLSGIISTRLFLWSGRHVLMYAPGLTSVILYGNRQVDSGNESDQTGTSRA